MRVTGARGSYHGSIIAEGSNTLSARDLNRRRPNQKMTRFPSTSLPLFGQVKRASSSGEFGREIAICQQRDEVSDGGASFL